MSQEGYDLLRAGLTGSVLNFEGEFYRFKDVPITLETVQKPYPPIWYGVVQPDSARRAGRRGFKVMSNTATANVRATAEKYWENFSAVPGSGTQPAFGMNRFVVVADTEDAAWAIARRAYRRWHESFMTLWKLHGIEPVGVNYPPEIDGQAADGRAVIGTPQAVLDQLQAQVEETGVNYLGCRFAFGDLSLAESMRSVELFAERVMPHLQPARRVAAESSSKLPADQRIE
jgi:alkanesulfonate monooxygenase SsuD/methylene tetrahydromethanopterin reductase-like flavin-dependent oxidoreductase (luciferase family)